MFAFWHHSLDLLRLVSSLVVHGEPPICSAPAAKRNRETSIDESAVLGVGHATAITHFTWVNLNEEAHLSDFTSPLPKSEAALVETGLSILINLQPDMELVGLVASAPDAVQAFKHHRPDVTLMDLDLPDGAAIQAIHQMLKVDPGACVIGSLTYEWDESCEQALQAGARRCITKDRLNQDLVSLVRDCAPRPNWPPQRES
jgi:CheY-like chemotaxis protein